MGWLVTIVVAVICIVIIGRAIATIQRQSMTAGEVGEYYVAKQLRRLNKKEYFVINDLLFRKQNGYTNQIDHVVVSPYGVFVIETKNIYGYIRGSEKSKLWRSYWKDGRDLAFDNPILQNEAHIEALSERLGVGAQIPYYSIIAFSPSATLQVSVNNVDVIYWTHVREIIRRYKVPVLSIDEVENIYHNILAMNITDPEVRKHHGQNANARKVDFQQRTDNALDNGKCPQCGGQLVLRNGRNGKFYGCSNYPNCRYTHPAYN